MGAQILIIEDNPTNLELMTYLLKAFGHAPLPANNGAAGMKLALSQLPDLILCDVQLPVLDGYEVARLLKNHADLKMIPLVAVTALAMVGDRDRVLAAGFDGYIPKPIDPEAFVAQTESFLDVGLHSSIRPVAIPATAPPVRLPPSRATVLAVDDLPVNRELIRSTLEPVGYRVVLADSVGEALMLARCCTPDLILSDIHLPIESGIDLLMAVKADIRLRSVPFICITSTPGGKRERTEAMALGVRCFLHRPIEPETLLDEIEISLSDRLQKRSPC